MSKTLLWLDDYRNPMEGSWLVFSPITLENIDVHWVKSYQQFIDWIKSNGLPNAICFDHDLGLEVAINARSKGISKRKSRLLKQEEKTGYDAAKWLIDYCINNKKKLPLYNIQSANPIGKENIDKLLKNFINYQNHE
jgi:hypothetical protein